MPNKPSTHFKCVVCRRRREGPPEPTDLLPQPCCWHCVREAKAEVQLALNPFKKDYERARTSYNETASIQQCEYLPVWVRQQGKCSRCRIKHYRMRAVFYPSERRCHTIRCLVCDTCYETPPKREPKPEKPTLPDWYQSMPWFMREFAFQNPAVQAEFKAKGLDIPTDPV